MAFPNNIVEGILVSPENRSRGSPFARNKGFSERFDKVFQDSGYETRGAGTPETGQQILWDVRALYGFFLWLQNQAQGETITATLKFSYVNFEKVTDLVNEVDWVDALDSAGSAFFTEVLNNTDEEAEVVRITSKVTAVRLDIVSTSNKILNGTFSAV